MKPQMIIMVGNIGSGKSTLVKKYVRGGYIVISRDALRYMIGAGEYRFDKDLEKFIRTSTLKIIEEFLKGNKSLIIDETNMNRACRQEFIKLAKQYNYEILADIMPRLTKKESVDRRMKNPHGQPNRKLWNTIWENFNNIYEIPTLNEGFDYIIQEESLR